MSEHVTQVVQMTPSVLLEFCRSFEQEYGLSSEEFYERHLKGEFVGIHDAYRWASYWEAYLERSQVLVPLQKGRSDSLTATG
jgi:hypothetical protein